MAVLSRMIFATLGAGAAASAPSSGLRGQVQQPSAPAAAAPQPATAGSSTAALASLAAVGVAAAAATSLRPRATKSAKVVRSAVGDSEFPEFSRAGSNAWMQNVTKDKFEPGVCFPMTEKWDPLNLASTDMKMERYTAVEIKHGRVAMIACIGYVLPEVFRFPGCETVSHGLDAFSETGLPSEGWAQLGLLIGAHEFLLKPGAQPGAYHGADYGFGTELLDGQTDAEVFRRMTVERNNGRLAMIAIMGLMVQDGMFPGTPIQQLGQGGFWGRGFGPLENIVTNIPIGGGYFAHKERAGHVAMRAGYSEVYTTYENGRYPPAPGKTWNDSLLDMPGEETEMSPSVPYLRFPKHLKGWVGGEKGFDPLGVSDALPVYHLREAELKHGRVCMLATIGWIATDCGLRFGGEQFQGASTLEAHNAMVEAGYMGPLLGAIFTAEVYSAWLILEGFGGSIERASGDYFLGKNFLPKDQEAEKQMKLKELENGRLAMIAFSGIVTVAQATGKTWPFI